MSGIFLWLVLRGGASHLSTVLNPTEQAFAT